MKSFMVFSFWFIITTMIGFTGCDRTSQSCPSKTESPQSASMAMLWNTLKKPKAQYAQNLYRLADSIPADELVPFLQAKVQAEWNEVIDPPIVPLDPKVVQIPPPSKPSDPNQEKIWREDIARRLNQPIDLNVTSATMSDIVTELQTKIGVNFLLDSRAAKDLEPVTLQVSGVTAQKALEQLMKITQLKYTLKDEVIYITHSKESDDLLSKTYDVRDLIVGSAGFNTNIVIPSDANSASKLPSDTTDVTVQDLIEVIKEVLPGVSSDQFRRIEPWQSGYLLVRQTAEVHEKISNLFGVFRKQQSDEKRLGPCSCVLRIFDHIGTPEALASIAEIEKKHSDPHIVDWAKNLLKHHGKKRPAFFGP